MKKIFQISLIISSIIFSSCTSGDEISNRNDLPNVVTFHAPDTNKDIYLMDINSSAKEVLATNLSQELNIPTAWRYYTLVDNKLSFIDRIPWSIWQKNVITGENLVKEDYYVVEQNSQTIFSTNSNTKLLNFYFKGAFENGFEAYLDITDISSNQLKKVYLGKYERLTSRVSGEKVIIKAKTSSNEESIILVDLLEASIIEKVDIGLANFRLAAMNDKELFVFLQDNTVSVYSMNDLTFIKSDDYDVLFYDLPILADYKIFDNKMVFPVPGVTANVRNYPAIYNFETKEINFINLSKTKTYLFEKLEFGVFDIEFLKVDLENEIVFVGFRQFGNIQKGGIAFVDFQGDVIDYILLDYYPTGIFLK